MVKYHGSEPEWQLRKPFGKLSLQVPAETIDYWINAMDGPFLRRQPASRSGLLKRAA